MYIRDNQTLADVCRQLEQAEVLAVDTEFMRERTYFARLCLIQVSAAGIDAIIDPFTVDDLGPFFRLLHDRRILKLLHAGGQDLEILFRLSGAVVAPVFDTQVAATLAGFPQQAGYGTLVRDLLGVALDKGDTYTDWAKRPLTDAQIEYALNDVRYLPALFERLHGELEKGGRLAWLADDFSRLSDPAAYEVVPEEQWRRLKRVSGLKGRQLGVVREVAAWREREAQRRDVPRRWLLGDESVVEIARRMPRTVDELEAVRGVRDKLPKALYADVLEAVEAGLALPSGELPELPKRRKPVGDVDAAVDLMAALVRQRAREHGVAMPLLATRDDLERLAAGERDTSPLLSGWRYGIVGSELVALLDGRIKLSLDDGALVIEREPS